ncbi:hypothetical protein [Peptoniphilus faecalis]|uniref:hypothetical protein n=1 Tax=Peptoniphilus faecalis TaxID=2731255 RepID=UPI001B8D5FA3|nr:hypothetical protein [Peptoniphilus faecalis]
MRMKEDHMLKGKLKPSNYKKSKTRKYKKDMEFRKNLKYDEKQDKYLSPDGKEFIRCKDKHTKKKSGYISTTKTYRCFDWNTNGQKQKEYISETFQKYREKSLKI